MVMTSSKENLMPNFASTFQPLIDQEGYLVNQDDLSCREVVGNALAILRTSKDHQKSKQDAKEIWDVALPEKLSMTTNSGGVKCLWIVLMSFGCCIVNSKRPTYGIKLNHLLLRCRW